MSQDRFCAICEQTLGGKDSEHVCRFCFRKAREPKERSLLLTEELAERIGYAYALGNFVNWGISKLIEIAQHREEEEVARREADAREQWKQIRKKILEDLDGTASK